MQPLLSGPAPAETLPVYDPASRADPSRGRDCTGNADRRLPVPRHAESSVMITAAAFWLPKLR